MTRTWRDRLDEGLLPEEIYAVGRAIEIETDPERLKDLGGSFDPFYPVAVSVLAAQARVLRGAPALSKRKPTKPPNARLARDLALYARASGIPTDLLAADVKRLACFYCTSEPPWELERALPSVPAQVAEIALACLDIVDGHRLVSRAAMRNLSPPKVEDRYLDPEAVQIVLTDGQVPETVSTRIPRLQRILQSTADTQEARIEQLRAKLAIEKARQALRRQKIVETYTAHLREKPT
jgi:hypothetical protein